jgi:hypothetical protein
MEKREIKFRIWNGHNMVDPKKTTVFAVKEDLKIDGLFIPFADEFKLMQYTGLKDKNGKEIYEGEILNYPGYLPLEVWFEDGAFLVGIKDKSDQHLFQSKAEYMEVIGNIYENPNLLTP